MSANIPDHFRILFDAMTCGFALHEILLDAEGNPCDYRFIDVNPAFEAITGLVRADIIGHCVREILPNMESFWIERYGAVALGGDSQQFDDFCNDLGRHYRVAAYCPAAGQFAVLVDDITILKRNEGSRRLAKTLLESTHHAVAITDAAARILTVNRAFTETTGYTDEEIIGRKIGMLFDEREGAAFDAAIWAQLTSHGFWQGDTCNRRKSGEAYLQRTTICAAGGEGGEAERYMVMFTDSGQAGDAGPSPNGAQ